MIWNKIDCIKHIVCVMCFFRKGHYFSILTNGVCIRGPHGCLVPIQLMSMFCLVCIALKQFSASLKRNGDILQKNHILLLWKIQGCSHTGPAFQKLSYRLEASIAFPLLSQRVSIPGLHCHLQQACSIFWLSVNKSILHSENQQFRAGSIVLYLLPLGPPHLPLTKLFITDT